MPRLARPLCALLLAAATACKLFDNDDEPGSLALSGTVRSARTATAPSRPIAGASVRVYWEGGGFVMPGDGRLLGEATTDTAGRFAARVAAPPGYAGPNCAVMGAEVSAPGFQTVRYADIVGAGGPNDTTCDSGRGTLDVELPPPLEPPTPGPAPAPSHHGIVRGFLRRDTLGTPLVGTAWLTLVGPAGASIQMPVEGSHVLTPADGSFRMRYVVGFRTAAAADSLVLDLVAQGSDTSKRMRQRLPLPRPRLLSEPPDSAVIALFFLP